MGKEASGPTLDINQASRWWSSTSRVFNGLAEGFFKAGYVFTRQGFPLNCKAAKAMSACQQ